MLSTYSAVKIVTIIILLLTTIKIVQAYYNVTGEYTCPAEDKDNHFSNTDPTTP